MQINNVNFHVTGLSVLIILFYGLVPLAPGDRPTSKSRKKKIYKVAPRKTAFFGIHSFLEAKRVLRRYWHQAFVHLFLSAGTLTNIMNVVARRQRFQAIPPTSIQLWDTVNIFWAIGTMWISVILRIEREFFQFRTTKCSKKSLLSLNHISAW